MKKRHERQKRDTEKGAGEGMVNREAQGVIIWFKYSCCVVLYFMECIE